jgi:dihydrofolate synthase/folylpolyglutamate synthase
VELDEAGAVVAARARELDVGILRPAVRVDGRRATVEQRNAALAELALEALCARGVRGPSGQPLVTRLDAGLLSAARLPARQERFVAGACPVVLDGAHTPGSVAAVLSDLWAATDLHGRPSVVLGMARDKDLAGILKVLAPAAEKVFGTSVGTELHRTPDEIAAAARAVGVEAQSASSPRAALDLALAHARSRGSWVLIVGSLYLAGALRPELRHIDP